MSLISTTTEAVLVAAIGAVVNPNDGVSVVDYQRTDISAEFDKHQIWVNWVRTDKTKLLKNLYRNLQTIHIVVVYCGLATADVAITRTSLVTLATAYNNTIKELLNNDPTFGGLARISKLTGVATDGGYMAVGSNPKSSTVKMMLVEWYSET